MLIDWVTCRVPLLDLSAPVRDALRLLGDRVLCYCPKSGEVRYESSKWDSVRSDSHQIAVRVGSDLWIQGSPARVVGAGDAVFGAGVSASLDLVGCVAAMVRFVAIKFGVVLPPANHWIVSRVDVTGNLLLPSLADVRTALTILRGCEGGRYRVSQQAGDTVYWSHTSKMRSGKAYAKGPHLTYMTRKPDYSGYPYTSFDIESANRLLRLELSLRREFWARNDWQQANPDFLRAQWRDYFDRMIGAADMTTADLRERVIDTALHTGRTENQGKAAYACWCVIQSQGWEAARDMYSKTTWYRHLQILRRAGLGDSDIAAGNVVPLRRRVLDAQLVTCWSDLHAA